MLRRLTRNLFVRLVRALHAGMHRLVLRLETGDTQDSARTQLVNQGAVGPPAHWLEVVRRHAPQLLRPPPKRREPLTGFRECSELNTAAPDPGTPLTPRRLPAAGQKTVAAGRHDTVPDPGRRRVQQRSVPAEAETQAGTRSKRSATSEGKRTLNRAPRDRHSSADGTAVQASGPAERKEPVVGPPPRSGRQPSGESPQLLQRRLLRPAGGEVLKPLPRSKAHDSSLGPADIRKGFSWSRGQSGSLCSEPGRRTDRKTQSTKRPQGAQAVQQIVAPPVREAIQVAAQALPRAGLSITAELLRSTPTDVRTPPVVELGLPGTGEAADRPLYAEPERPRIADETDVDVQSTRTGAEPWPSLPETAWDPRARLSPGEAADRPLYPEPEWPRLADETDVDVQSARTGAESWPSLPETSWDPGARLSPGEALQTASEERRNSLRLRRRDLEQRGELWNV